MAVVEEKILLIKLRTLGDTVMASATIDELKRNHPQCHIHLVIEERWMDLYKGDPRIDTLFTCTHAKRGITKIFQTISLGLTLRAQKYDKVIVLHANPTGNHLAKLSGAPVQVVHNHNFKKHWGNSPIPGEDQLQPSIQRDLLTLKAIGVMPREKPITKLFLAKSEEAWVDNYLKKNDLKAPLLAIGLGASRKTKIWPIERYASLAKSWVAKTDGSVVALLTPREHLIHANFLKY